MYVWITLYLSLQLEQNHILLPVKNAHQTNISILFYKHATDSNPN